MNFNFDTPSSKNIQNQDQKEDEKQIKEKVTHGYFPKFSVKCKDNIIMNKDNKKTEYFYPHKINNLLIYMEPLLKYHVPEGRRIITFYNDIIKDMHPYKEEISEATLKQISDNLHMENDNNPTIYNTIESLDTIQGCHYYPENWLMELNSIVTDIFILCKAYGLGNLELPSVIYNIESNTEYYRRLFLLRNITLADFEILLDRCVYDFNTAVRMGATYNTK